MAGEGVPEVVEESSSPLLVQFEITIIIRNKLHFESPRVGYESDGN